MDLDTLLSDLNNKIYTDVELVLKNSTNSLKFYCHKVILGC